MVAGELSRPESSVYIYIYIYEFFSLNLRDRWRGKLGNVSSITYVATTS